MNVAVLIYAKPPVIGLSKTRLARSLGPGEARRIARWTMSRTINEGCDPRWQTVLYTTPDRALTQSLGPLWPTGLCRRSQGAGGLTERLEKGLAEAPLGKVLFIGADAPDISRGQIWLAIRKLDRHDAVFGPATDGGFWLFGLKKRPRTQSPFRHVRWSTPHTTADVRKNLKVGTRVAAIDTLIDIDDADDWWAWQRGWLNAPG